jgi:hypothetical protein
LKTFVKIIEISCTYNITTRKVRITGGLKFENGKFENCNFNVSAGKEK